MQPPSPDASTAVDKARAGESGHDGWSVDEKLPAGRLLLYGVQHVLAMYVGAVAVPLIVARALGLTESRLVALINADLFTCGLATLLQTLGWGPFGIRLPIIQGVTFAAVGPMIAIGSHLGLPAVYGSILASGLLTLLISPYFGRIVRFIPERTVGIIMLLIGISLMPVAVRWAGGGDPSAPDFGSVTNVALAFGVLGVIVVLQRLLTGFGKSISVLIGLALGTAVAVAMGQVSTSGIAEAPWLGFTRPLAFGPPVFDASAIVSMTLVMLVVMIETTGDFLAIGEIVGRPVDANALTRGLRADGLSTMLGGLLNSFPYTAYAQNVGLVSLTGVKSRFVVAAAGAILVGLGHLPKAAALVAAVPAPVLGGCGLAMFGMVAAGGIAALSKVRLQGTFDGLVVGVSLAVGMIPLCAPGFFGRFPAGLQIFLQSGITLGTATALVLGLFERAALRQK